MTLPSQTHMPLARRSSMRRRRRRHHRAVLLLGTMLGVIVAAWWFGPWRRSPGDATPPPPPLARDEPAPIRHEPTPTSWAPPAVVVTPAPTPRTTTLEPVPAIAAPVPVTSVATPGDDPEAMRSARSALTRGEALLASNDLLGARGVLSTALLAGELVGDEARRAKSICATISEHLVFGPAVVAGDPYTLAYVVQGGDSLARIAKRTSVQVEWSFLQRINGIRSPHLIRPGQRLKLVTGPFHAIVSKEQHALDLWLGEGDERVYVRSFRVGLGEGNSTPDGLFRVRGASKAVDPQWQDPVTRRVYAGGDPENPIGRHWIGLEGAADLTRGIEGCGLHGTIEPESIGRNRSMGCLRMLPDDIALLYEVLVEGVSLVDIRPGVATPPDRGG